MTSINGAGAVAARFQQLGLTVLERGWLSSNNTVFRATADAPATVVDTGHAAHAAQTVALVRQQLQGQPLERIVNTHLHSDHCGGNAALHAVWGCATWVAAASLEAVAAWDEERLTYRMTDQACDRFTAQAPLVHGSVLRLGTAGWHVVAAPGHDPDAVMLFEPVSRTLISGDALWEKRLAIIFPELTGKPGFDAARSALDCIESLAPTLVIPGHGAPFTDVATALRNSRERIANFQAHPAKHALHAARALLMFHLLTVRSVERNALLQWLVATPIFRPLRLVAGTNATGPEALLDGLLRDGLVWTARDGRITVDCPTAAAEGNAR